MRYPIGFALLLPMALLAKDPPVPEALLNAKTAFIENAGALDKDFEKFRTKLMKWGRFTVVQNRSSADIIISLSRGITDLYARRWDKSVTTEGKVVGEADASANTSEKYSQPTYPVPIYGSGANSGEHSKPPYPAPVLIDSPFRYESNIVNISDRQSGRALYQDRTQ
jgi:hypothetical protein